MSCVDQIHYEKEMILQQIDPTPEVETTRRIYLHHSVWGQF